MTKPTKAGSGEAELDSSSGRHRWGRGAIAGVGAGALVLAAVTAVAFWPEDNPSSPNPSGNVSPSPTATASEPRDLPWGEPIPWDEVGPGWTLLAYDAVPGEGEWGEEWSRTGDELWLLAPDGTLFFGADISGLGDTEVEAWTGREAWLYMATEYQGEGSSSGTLWNVDLVDGTVTVVAEDSPPYGSRESTAVDGVYVNRGGCCGCTETTVHSADGTVLFSTEGCGESRLSPDGLTLAYVREVMEAGGEYSSTFMVTDLEGNSTPVAVSPWTNWSHALMWLNDTTLLVLPGGDDDPVLATLDVASGESVPWSGTQPEGFYLNFWEGYPGSWLIWEAYEPERITRLTDRVGTLRLDLACSYPSCTLHATGGLVIWEESDVEYQDGVRIGEDLQRLTLIDPASWEQTLILEYRRADGHITTVLPHPPVYG